MLAFRVGFDAHSRRATSGRFLLASVLMLLLGDLTVLLGEVHLINVSPAIGYTPVPAVCHRIRCGGDAPVDAPAFGGPKRPA